MFVRGLRALALTVVFALVSTAASAQTFQASSSTSDFLTAADFNAVLTYGRRNNVSVKERPRPDYEALGIRRGGFLVFPRVEAGVGVTNNILSSRTNPESAAFATLSPSIAAESQWSLHALSLSAGLQTRAVADHRDEGQTGGYINFAGRYDASSDLVFSGATGVSRTFEGRTSANSPQDIARPIEVDQVKGGVRAVRESGRLRGMLGVDGAVLDYKDVDTFSGAVVDQDYRDQSVVRLTAKGEIALSPDTSLFAVANRSAISYRQGGVLDRSSKEVRGLVGGNFDITALIRGEVGVGYIRREYDNAAFDTLKGVAALARVEYFPTQLITVTGQFRRAIDDSAVGSVSGFFLNDASLSVDYELLRNLIVSGQASYRIDDFKGLDRKDKLKGASLAAQYLVTRSVGLAATLSYVDRSSAGAFKGPSFDATQLALSVILQR